MASLIRTEHIDMLSNKNSTIVLVAAVAALNFAGICQAASAADSKAKNALTLSISAPDPRADLQLNEKPDPVYLQVTNNNGSAPVYSAPIIPGDTKSVELKIASASTNGSQLQFVSNSAGNVQPMSFVYVLSGERLACLINKNAKIQVEYSINTKLLDVRDIPAGC